MGVLYRIAINDANYAVKPREGDHCPFYLVWSAMIDRCYGKRTKSNNNYKGCSVCEEWLTFSNFRAWMETQDWKGKELDKDLIIPENKIYSPRSCVFVSREVNAFLVRPRSKTTTPLGVYAMRRKGRVYYKAQIKGIGKAAFYLGIFPTPLEAHRTWQTEKLKRIIKLIEKQDDKRVIDGLKIRQEILKNDLQNGRETIKL